MLRVWRGGEDMIGRPPICCFFYCCQGWCIVTARANTPKLTLPLLCLSLLLVLSIFCLLYASPLHLYLVCSNSLPSLPPSFCLSLCLSQRFTSPAPLTYISEALFTAPLSFSCCLASGSVGHRKRKFLCSFILSLSFFLSFCLTPSLSFSLFLSYCHFLFLFYLLSFSLFLSYSLVLSLSFCFTPSFSFSLSLSFCLTPYLSLMPMW